MFIYKLTKLDRIKPGSGIANTVTIANNELRQLVDRYYALPKNSWYYDPKSHYRYDWADYGKVWHNS